MLDSRPRLPIVSYPWVISEEPALPNHIPQAFQSVTNLQTGQDILVQSLVSLCTIKQRPGRY
jgi:hypothetical protein